MMPAGSTGNDALRNAIPRLAGAGVPDPATDARHLLAHAMQIGLDRLTLHLPDVMTDQARARYADALQARMARQPVAQITGTRAFWGRDFRVTRDTLDPRPETEVLVAEAVSRPFLKVLDLGTGTGCILLSCLGSMPMAVGLGVDISDAALEVARDNAERNHCSIAYFEPEDFGSVRPDTVYDVVAANILSGPLKLMAPMLCGRVKPGGALVLSGVLARQADEVIAAYASRIRLSVWAEREGWVALAGRLDN